MSTEHETNPEHPATETGPDAATPETPSTPEQLMQAAVARIAELEAERDEFKDKWMRSEAESANVRTRARRDADDARQYAVQKFATDVVEAAENLKRGIDSLPPPSDDQPAIVVKVREGLEGVERSFIGVLERNGIKKEDPVGQPFDPNKHQAMQEQETADHKAGTVLQAWTACWTLNGRLLKPSMVVVAKAPPGEIANNPA